MTIPSLTTPDDGQWEETLRQWAGTMSPATLEKLLPPLMYNVTPPDEHLLLDAIARQYQQPDAQRRWHIFELAKNTGFNTPAGALALAQFWSSGSLSPDGLLPVYPDPQLSQHMLHCALVMLVARLRENPAEGVRHLIALTATPEVI